MGVSVYEYQPSFILGFHGCDKSVAEKLFAGEIPHLNKSEKKYDWLGHGIYFWEGNPSRAYDWALQRKAAGVISDPAVVGAIIDLRHCLDLFDHDALARVKTAYEELHQSFEEFGFDLPKNVGNTPDKAGRALDCAVMNNLHALRKLGNEQPYDSVRAPFLEGEPLYDNSGFRSHNHIQICVCDRACIKGYFRPIEA